MVSVTKKPSRRAISRVLAVPVLVLCFGLGACSDDDTPTDSPTSTTASDESAFVGDWTIEQASSSEQTFTAESMREQGFSITLAVRADGTFTMTGTGEGAPEPQDGTWTATSGTDAVFTAEGSDADVTLDGDRLTLVGGANVFVFVRS